LVDVNVDALASSYISASSFDDHLPLQVKQGILAPLRSGELRASVLPTSLTEFLRRYLEVQDSRKLRWDSHTERHWGWATTDEWRRHRMLEERVNVAEEKYRALKAELADTTTRLQRSDRLLAQQAAALERKDQELTQLNDQLVRRDHDLEKQQLQLKVVNETCAKYLRTLAAYKRAVLMILVAGLATFLVCYFT
jgi:hypothetical protein